MWVRVLFIGWSNLHSKEIGKFLIMKKTENLFIIAQTLREDTISSFQKTAGERPKIGISLEGDKLLAEVELTEIFYLGLLSRIAKGSSIPKEYATKAQEYSVLNHDSVVAFIMNERKNYPVYYEHLFKIEMCRSLFLFYTSK